MARLLIKLGETNGEIKPKYDLTRGYTYPEIENIIGKDFTETDKFLRWLAKLGILDKKILGMVIYCPLCNSANVSTNYACPYCGSFQITRNALIEHVTCGYINNLTSFMVENDLICPKCKAKLGRGDTRSAGRWYECVNCKRRIENLQTIHICRDCAEKFDFNDAKYTEAYNYYLSEVERNEINSGALFSSLAEKFLTDLNYDVKVPGKVVGSSGIQQEFDFIVKVEDGRLLAIDALFSNEPVDQQQIMREYGKIFDTKVEAYIIVPSLNEETRKLAKIYNLNIIEADPSSAISELKKVLLSKKLLKINEKKTEPETKKEEDKIASKKKKEDKKKP